MAEAIVIYPAPLLTHQTPMAEFAKLLLTHHPSLSIHILIATTIPSQLPSSAIPPNITCHYLPAVDLPPSSTGPLSLLFDAIRLNNPNLRRALLTISNNYTLNAVIFDFFCTRFAFEVVSDLKIPAYCFCTIAAGSLSSLLYLPTLHNRFTENFQDLNVLVDIPGVPPIPSSDMPSPVLKRNEWYEIFLNNSTCLPHLTGIIVNTFECLESKAIKAIRDGLCVPEYPMPPLYCIGPSIAYSTADGGDVPYCLKWLDSQPSKSVVFLCFGSSGSFSIQQIKEIAVGLESSGQRFLWVLKNPPLEDQSLDQDLNSLLPQGFLERTKERGLVVKSWAPQTAVLNHDSIGGFITHCGWNSVLESVCAGVPMLAWPLHAEQRLNRVLMVEEMKIALPMVESETGFVCSTEVEKRVKELIESQESDSVRQRTLDMKRAAEVATSEGGSSRTALVKLLESWKLK